MDPTRREFGELDGLGPSPYRPRRRRQVGWGARRRRLFLSAAAAAAAISISASLLQSSSSPPSAGKQDLVLRPLQWPVVCYLCSAPE
jgi:hypothetical protein